MKQWATRGNDIVYSRQVSGGTALAQRHEHMLKTTAGDLPSDAEWGIGIKQYKGQTEATADPRTLADIFRGQHLRDPETADVDAVVKLANGTLEYEATFTGEDGAQSTLALVV